MRYLILVLLNVPIILAALINIITQYKLRKVSVTRFRHQLIIWMLFYIANNQRQRIDQNERRLRDLHQELSIRLSNEK